METAGGAGHRIDIISAIDDGARNLIYNLGGLKRNLENGDYRGSITNHVHDKVAAEAGGSGDEEFKEGRIAQVSAGLQDYTASLENPVEFRRPNQTLKILHQA